LMPQFLCQTVWNAFAPCTASILTLFAKSEADPDPDLSGFWMWWDLVLDGFWTPPKPFVAGTYRGDASKLDSESRILLDVMFETLTRILDLPHLKLNAARCTVSAISTTLRATLFSHYIDANNSEFRLAWLEQCRDGTVQ